MRPSFFILPLLAACASCSSSSSLSSSSTATIAITSPKDGDSVPFSASNTDVNISFTTTNITLMDVGKCGTTANCGHVEAFIDGTTCNDKSNPAAVKPYNDSASASPMTAGLDYCPKFPDVAGSHMLTLELHKDDLSPIKGADGTTVSAKVSFTAVSSGGSGTGGSGGTSSSAGAGGKAAATGGKAGAGGG